MTRKALGRGLSALIPAASDAANGASILAAVRDGRPIRIPIDKIRPNHLQPRRHFDADALSELAASIKKHGLAQPIVVSHETHSNSYELIAGERRWRASRLAGLQEIEAVIKEPNDDKHRMALTLIENLQRSDLNPVEVALGYLRLMKEFGMNQTELGQELGKSKSAVSNTLRLLDLPEEMQRALQSGQLTEGHGRALMMVSAAAARALIFQKVLADQLSVRETENLAKQAENGGLPGKAAKAKKTSLAKPADLRALEDSLQHSLGTKVVVRTKKGSKGTITIHFFSLDDFDRIVKKIKR